MPNWCFNSTTLSNDDVTKIDALVEKLEGGDNVFQYLRPRPEAEEDSWYEWNVANWGTKWDASMQHWERTNETTVQLHYDTAWSPPGELFEYLVEEGWWVDSIYHEEGMGFIGSYVDGVDSYYEYDLSDRASIEALPQELIDFGDLITLHEEWFDEDLEDEA